MSRLSRAFHVALKQNVHRSQIAPCLHGTVFGCLEEPLEGESVISRSPVAALINKAHLILRDGQTLLDLGDDEVHSPRTRHEESHSNSCEKALLSL